MFGFICRQNNRQQRNLGFFGSIGVKGLLCFSISGAKHKECVFIAVIDYAA
jgi:hypothetical protein